MFVTFFAGDQSVQCSLNEADFNRFRVDFDAFRSTGLPLGGVYYDEGIEAEFFVSFQSMRVAEVTDKPRPKMRNLLAESQQASAT